MAHSKAPAIPPTERIGGSYKKLASISPELHSAANELSDTVNALSNALEPLSLGISAWYTIAGDEDESGYYWNRAIGYTQVRNQWCIALKKASGNKDDNEHDEQVWEFSKAPRWMVIESIAKLPDLFETLIERVGETTERLRARDGQAKELLTAVKVAAAELESRAEIAAPKCRK